MDIQQFIAVFLAICGGIITVSGAIGWIIKWVQAAKKPSDDLRARVSNLETQIATSNREIREKFMDYDQYFHNDKTRIDEIESNNKGFQRMVIQSLQALTDHALNGNNNKGLEDASEALNRYLTNKI